MQTTILKKWWLSWVQPTEDFRPLSFPPNKDVLGWWCSGYSSDEHAILCAAVQAVDEDAAWEAIMKDWPDMGEVRFCGSKDSEWLPSDRFPLRTRNGDDWMAKRFADFVVHKRTGLS